MDYQALYRKYRPQTFDDVIGQVHVTSTLSREVAEGHVAHAYLFAGPRGTGKTTTARILAKALNCEDRNPDGSPDNTCASCVAITEGTSLDVLELDAASHNSVDDIREMRVSVSTVASSAAGRRVFILDEAHMLSKAAGNALLKTLEEPPPNVHFVLATTEPYKLLDTIRSRAQRFDFHAVPVEALAAHLARISDLEGYDAEPQALVAVSRHALGSVRDSLSLMEQVAALGDGTVDVAGVSRALGLADADAFAALVEALASQDAREALELVARLASEGVDLRRFASEAVGFFRGIFLAHYAPNLAEVADEPPDVLEAWKKASARLPASDVLRAVDLLGEALVRLREGREERLMLELALIRLTRPETSTEPEALLARMERLERRVGHGAAPEAARGPRRSTGEPPEPVTSVPGGIRPVPTEEPAEEAKETADETTDETTEETAEDQVPEPEAAPAVTLDDFRSVWPQLFGGLRDVLGARRWALFRETEPGTVEGSTLIVHVKHPFHLKALRDDEAVTSIVATKAGDLLGVPVAVDFRPPDGEAPVVSQEDHADPEMLTEAPPEATDPFRLVEDQLGGTVVDEYETE